MSDQGASQATGLAGAEAPEPPSRLGPTGGIPCAGFRCVHCGHQKCASHIFSGEMKGVEMVDCAACGKMHSPPDPFGKRALWDALEAIEQFGYANSGHGFSCARMASLALGKEPR